MFRAGAALALCATTVTAAHAAPMQPEPVHREIAQLVAFTLRSEHYSQRDIDDTVAAEWFDTYLQSLDYSRVYLLQSDVDAFRPMVSTLDDDLMSGNPQLELCYGVHERYKQRVHERIDKALALLDQPWTFDDASLSVDLDRQEDPWATTSEELDAIWRTRVGGQLLGMELSVEFDDDDDDSDTDDEEPKLTPEELRAKNLDRLRKRYKRLSADIDDLDATDVLETCLGSLTRVYDPHSVWFKPVSKDNFDIEMADSLTGIGAELRQIDGYTTITRVIPGGPAEMSGELEADDRIVAVSQGEGEPEDVIDMRLDKVVQLIRGRIDTPVVLTIWPGGSKDPSELVDVKMIRKKVKLDRAAAKGEVREVEGLKVGVLDVPSFYRDSEAKRNGDPNWGGTTRDSAKILEDFKTQGAEVVVVDLRKNGGGRLDEALGLTGLFINGPVVQIRARNGKTEVLDDPSPNGVAWTGPVVVLTSEASASASEIFAAAIQDHQRGLIVGADSTHGKGTVQDLQGYDRYFMARDMRSYVGKGGAMKYTTHMFFRPEGGSTQVRGVKSDVVLPSPYEGMKIKEGDLPHALPWDKIAAARYKTGRLEVDLAALRAASAERVAQSMEFAFIREDVLERERAEEKQSLSLHMDTRRKELARSEAMAEARETARKAAGWDGEADIDPILDEALMVARDMVRQLKG